MNDNASGATNSNNNNGDGVDINQNYNSHNNGQRMSIDAGQTGDADNRNADGHIAPANSMVHLQCDLNTKPIETQACTTGIECSPLTLGTATNDRSQGTDAVEQIERTEAVDNDGGNDDNDDNDDDDDDHTGDPDNVETVAASNNIETETDVESGERDNGGVDGAMTENEQIAEESEEKDEIEVFSFI